MNNITPKKLLILLITLTALFFFSLAIYFYHITSSGMPSLTRLENPEQELSTQIFSADGQLIGTFYSDQRRFHIPYDSIPPAFVSALVASEDRKFHEHWGADPDRILKAIVKRVIFGQRSGASTITQQVARNLFLNQDKKLERKIREVATAFRIEQIYTKEQILEMYANTVLFGRGSFGIGVAAKSYFNKNPMDLTTGECAMLVGVLPRPSAYNPFRNYEMAIHRRNIVLNVMVETGALSPSLAAIAKNEEIILNYSDKQAKTPNRKVGDNIAPHFLEMLRQEFSTPEMLSRFNIYRDGMVINTTLNSTIQKYANDAVEQHLTVLQEKFDRRYRWRRNDVKIAGLINKCIQQHNRYRSAQNQSAKKVIANQLRNNKQFMDSVRNVATTIQCGVVVIDTKTGAIIAMVGASTKSMKDNSQSDYSLNHITQIKRQPGSAMKPFVYASALSNGYTPESIVECGPFSYMLFDSTYWSPSGTGSCEQGDTRTLVSAFQWSINTVAARLITSATNPQEVIHICRKAGIKSKLDPYPALSLGAGGDIRPMELASAFQIFSNDGLYRSNYYYNYIADKKGNEIEDLKPEQKISDVLKPEIAKQMVYMMEKVISNGTASSVKKYFTGIDAAGKTGTTNDAADAWFTGYTPELVACVWVGFDDKRVTFDCLGSAGYGGKAAAPIWGILMDKIYKNKNLTYHKRKFDYKNQKYDNNRPYPLTSLQKSFNPEPLIDEHPMIEIIDSNAVIDETYE